MKLKSKDSLQKTVESDYKESEILDVKNKLVSILNQFVFSKDTYIRKYAKQKKTNVILLQENVCNYLKETIADFEWECEYRKDNSEHNDKIDIFGKYAKSDLKVIIELDGVRPPQIAKKFLSRNALFIEENIIYISLCYPCTEKNPNECLKYFEYCKTISEFISRNTDVAKLYTGILLEPKK